MLYLRLDTSRTTWELLLTWIFSPILLHLMLLSWWSVVNVLPTTKMEDTWLFETQTVSWYYENPPCAPTNMRKHSRIFPSTAISTLTIFGFVSTSWRKSSWPMEVSSHCQLWTNTTSYWPNTTPPPPHLPPPITIDFTLDSQRRRQQQQHCDNDKSWRQSRNCSLVDCSRASLSSSCIP